MPLVVDGLTGNIADLRVELRFDGTDVDALSANLVHLDSGSRVELFSAFQTDFESASRVTMQFSALASSTPIVDVSGAQASVRLQPRGTLSIFEGLDPNGLWQVEFFNGTEEQPNRAERVESECSHGYESDQHNQCSDRSVRLCVTLMFHSSWNTVLELTT